MVGLLIAGCGVLVGAVMFVRSAVEQGLPSLPGPLVFMVKRDCNLRESPGEIGGVIGTVTRGGLVSQRGQRPGGKWVPVLSEGKEGWVHETCLEVSADGR